jgi:hypothetical protein
VRADCDRDGITSGVVQVFMGSGLSGVTHLFLTA